MIATKTRRLPETTEAPATAEPDAKALRAYQAAVFAAEENGGVADTMILLAACRTSRDFELDRRTYRERLAAADTLNNKVPELEKQLLAAEQRAAAVANIVDVKLASIGTLGELVSALAEFGRFQDSLPSADLMRPRPTVKTAEAIEAQQLRSNIQSIVGRATETLAKTAAVDPALPPLYAERAALNRELASRNQPNLDAMIESKRQEVEQLVVQPNQDSRRPHREQLAVAKHELAKLEARKASPTDCIDGGEQARLDVVNEKIVKSESKRDPKCMKWC